MPHRGTNRNYKETPRHKKLPSSAGNKIPKRKKNKFKKLGKKKTRSLKESLATYYKG